MYRIVSLFMASLLVVASVSALSLDVKQPIGPDMSLPDVRLCELDEDGVVQTIHQYPDPNVADGLITVHAVCHESLVESSAAPAVPDTDCESDAFRLTGWRWTEKVDFVVDILTADYLGFVDPEAVVAGTAQSMDVWDDETGASIAGTVSTGSLLGTTFVVGNSVNEISFLTHPLAPSAVAVTVTFSSNNGVARESDAYYNPIWAWSTDNSGGFDYMHVATHEIGHTFGLDHPASNNANSCLTMYAFTSTGAIHARSLGDGDILGIRAIYGA